MTIFFDFSELTILGVMPLIAKFCTWFFIGSFHYPRLSVNLKNLICRLNFIKLFFLLFIILYSFLVLQQFLIDFIFIEYSQIDLSWATSSAEEATKTNDIKSDSSITDSTTSNNNNKNNNNNSNNNNNKVGDSAIMATSLAGAYKFASQSPSLSGKTAALAGGLAIGSLGIIAKNTASNISKDFPTKKLTHFFVENSDSYIKDILNLPGDSILDLLMILKLFLNIQWSFLILIIYYLILMQINESKLELLLKKIFPNSLVNFLIKFTLKFKKLGFNLIIIFFILLIIDMFLFTHYFNFFTDNFDQICELYYEKNLKK